MDCTFDTNKSIDFNLKVLNKYIHNMEEWIRYYNTLINLTHSKKIEGKIYGEIKYKINYFESKKKKIIEGYKHYRKVESHLHEFIVIYNNYNTDKININLLVSDIIQNAITYPATLKFDHNLYLELNLLHTIKGSDAFDLPNWD